MLIYRLIPIGIAISAAFLASITVWGALQIAGAISTGPIYQAAIVWRIVWFALAVVVAVAITKIAVYLRDFLCWYVVLRSR
ncbi:MAG: hypothetical protein HYS60_00170 [Candidatus Wildermuthbacteria bacterium]|nr:hypothetical protein [Candidatus Wildermuthbacteria bacterium]